MKKQFKWLKTICILLVIGYFTMTKIGALRLAIIIQGHPLSAFSLEIMDEPYHIDNVEENQTAYSLANPPFEKATQSELINWVVTKHGIFYTAIYYGW